MADQPTVYENDVRFEETDMQGIVFYGNYITYQDMTMSEFRRKLGYDYFTVKERGWDLHVGHVDLDYHHPASFGDRIENSMRVESIGNSSITYAYAARRKSDGTLLVDGSVVEIVVDAESGEPTRVPDEFREAVVEFQDEPPESY